MADVRKLIEKRDALFKEQSDNILTQLEHVTRGVKEFLSELDPSYLPGEFLWEDISIFQHSQEEDLLMLIGYVRYPVGTQLTLDEKIIIVDEQNQDYFDRIMRMGVPFSVVNKNDPAAVKEFLAKVTPALSDEEPISEDDLQEAVDAINEDAAEPESKRVKVEAPGKHDFDLDDLTEEQKAALRLYNLSSRQ